MDWHTHHTLTSQPLLQGISATDLTEMLDKQFLKSVVLEDGEKWVGQGDYCQQLAFLVSGSLRVETTFSNGRYQLIEYALAPATIEPDILFGIQREYTSSYYANGECHMFVVPKNRVSQMLATNEVFRLNFLNLISTLAVRRRLSTLPSPTPSLAARIVHFLTSHLRQTDGKKAFHIRISDIADALGVTRAIVSLSLHEMEEKGLLQLGKAHIEVPDMNLLNSTYLI